MTDNLVDRLLQLPQDERFILRLYIAGCTPQSSRAITNLKTICEIHLKGRYDFTIVDVSQEKERARQDQIVVAPTLIRRMPLPERRVIGDLSRTDHVLKALGLTPAEHSLTSAEHSL